jgi:hypothetical protein
MPPISGRRARERRLSTSAEGNSRDRYDPVILAAAKTAVSIPTPLFEAAERQAKKRGITRSQLYAEALKKILADDRAAEITAQLNAVYGEEEAERDPFLTEAAKRVFERVEW